MKVQRKLTDGELEDVLFARKMLRRTTKFALHTIPVCHALDVLDEMALHATTDGHPYVDPEPPIPDGYRLAVAGDERRSDRKYWAESLNQWVSATCMTYRTDVVFIVPADREPTDEDAKSRPEVMVRDCDAQRWCKHVLLMVRIGGEHNKYKFVTTSKLLMDVACWKQCRHLYPGE